MNFDAIPCFIRFRKEGSKESAASQTPRKMLAKLNSLTIGSFSKQSTDEV